MSDESAEHDRPRRQRRMRSIEEARTLVAAWDASGLGIAAFCQQHGLLRSALASCRRRVAAADGAFEPTVATAEFVGLRAPAVSQAQGLIVRLRDGTECEITASWQVSLLPDVISALHGAGR